MAVSASALTLAQYALLSNDPLVKKVTHSLLMYGNVLEDIPLVSKKTLIANGVRWEGNLPTVTWAPLNSDPTVSSGTPTPYQEQAYLIRNAIDVDRFLVEDENQIVDPRGSQVDAFLRAVTYDVNDKFINNHPGTGDANAPVGLKERIDSYATYGVRSENKIDGGGVDMTQANMTAATANTFLEFLDQLLWSVDSKTGQGCCLYMNEVMLRRLARACRLLGSSALDITRDNYDREILTYRGAKLVDIGYKADQSTRIITVTEANTGAAGSSTYTSIYAAHYGEEHLLGWQFEPLAPKDIGLVGNGGTIFRVIFDWAFGLLNQHTRSMARLYGIKLS